MLEVEVVVIVPAEVRTSISCPLLARRRIDIEERVSRSWVAGAIASAHVPRRLAVPLSRRSRGSVHLVVRRFADGEVEHLYRRRCLTFSFVIMVFRARRELSERGTNTSR